MRRWPILALIFIVSVSALHADDLARQLRDKYQNKAFLIRGFPADNILHYDSSGVLRSPAPRGSWANAGIHVNSIQVHRGRVEFKGHRVVPSSTSFAGSMQPNETDINISLSIAIDRKTKDRTDAVLRAAEKVFADYQAPPPRELAPEYWAALENTILAKDVCDEHATVEHPCRVRDDVTAPKPIQTPDPEYSEPARQARRSGMVQLVFVVDQAGLPQNIHVVLPLGWGLDEQAINAVRQWRFQPATFNGKPVPVLLTTDIEFRLY